MEVLFIDHYDSFSYNVLDWLGGKGCPFQFRHIAFDDPDLLKYQGAGIPMVLSPGPKSPKEAAPSLTMLRAIWARAPILGICLGHQIIGEFLGASLSQAEQPFHGSVRDVSIRFRPPGLARLPSSLRVATYNSLIVDRKKLCEDWVFAENEWHEVEGIYLAPTPQAPVLGLQFHPESFMSEETDILRSWWWAVVEAYFRPQPLRPCQFLQSSGP